MKEVVVLGVGLHKFGRFPEKTVEELAEVAIRNALNESGVPFNDIQAAYVGHAYQPMGTGWRVVKQFGETGIPIVDMVVGAPSSAHCLVRAASEIATGVYDVVLVAGVEKMEKGLISGLTSKGSFEEVMGLLVMPADMAMMAKRHMKEYGTTVDQLAMCSAIEHRNGALNPYAHHQKPCTVQEVLNSRMIADPITLLMCSPTSDGASAAVLCSREMAAHYAGKRPITVASWAVSSGKYSHDGPMEAVAEVAQEAYEKAGIGPEDVGITEIHDAFSPERIFIAEALGLIPEGEGGPWVEAGRTDINGDVPIDTDGGLVAKGHPIGATGLSQVCEIIWQLRGEAGPRQVTDPKVGLQEIMGLGDYVVCIYKK